MSEASNASSGGIGFCGLLGIVFITLKLCHVVNWSWWWVTCPLWGPFAAIIAVVLFCLVMAGIAGICEIRIRR